MYQYFSSIEELDFSCALRKAEQTDNQKTQYITKSTTLYFIFTKEVWNPPHFYSVVTRFNYVVYSLVIVR